MKSIKNMKIFMLLVVAIAMVLTGFLYGIAKELDDADQAHLVDSFPDHSEITPETLKP